MQTLDLHHLFFTNEKKRETADFSTEADSAALKIIKIKTSTWIALISLSQGCVGGISKLKKPISVSL